MKCPRCPFHVDRIAELTAELDRLKARIAEWERLITDLRATLGRSERDAQAWQQERATLSASLLAKEEALVLAQTLLDKAHLQLSTLLQDKARTAALLDDRLRQLERQGDEKGRALEAENRQLQARVEQLEQRVRRRSRERGHRSEERLSLTPQTPRGPPTPAAAETPVAAPLQSLEVHSPALQVRVIDAEGLDPAPQPTEAFVRLSCGAATQFTQPAAVTHGRCEWNHDFIFVDLPTRPTAPAGELSVEALVRIEVVGRAVGGAAEAVLGSRQYDLSHFPPGLVLATGVPLDTGGKANVTLVGANFGPSVETAVAEALLRQPPAAAATARPPPTPGPGLGPGVPSLTLPPFSPWRPSHAGTPAASARSTDTTLHLSTISDVPTAVSPRNLFPIPQPPSWPATPSQLLGLPAQLPWPGPSTPAPYFVSPPPATAAPFSPPPPAWPVPLPLAVGPAARLWLPPTQLFTVTPLH